MAHEALIKEVKKAALKENLPPKEVEKYLFHELKDKKEAEQVTEQIKAAQLVDTAKKAEKESKSQKASAQQPSQNKSSRWILIIIILVVVVLAYLFYSGTLNLEFINFK